MTADELRAIAARHAKDDTALYYTGDTAETMHQDRAALLAIVRRVAEMDALEFFDDRRGMGYECRFCADAYSEAERFRLIAEALQSQASEGAEALAHRWLEMQRELRDLTEENTVLRSTVERLKRQRVAR